LNIVLTLDPKKFAEKKQQRLRIGNVQSFTPHVSLQSGPVKRVQLFYGLDPGGKRELFHPPDMKAFLYYSMLPEKPRIAGEMRLRLTSSDDPASFESGSDLLRANGQPWSRPLISLAKYYSPLYEKLREEGFVPDDLDAALSTLPPIRQSYFLYTLNDTFTLDFSSNMSKLSAITEQGVGRSALCNLFVDYRKLQSKPYTGAYTNHHLSILLNLLFS
jgi:hypothetical protein